ncbi:MAG: bifunctional diaminohydroxyphosphoribosylaminopyrimidine deaminase/5-amino-6-(5-phosphoribosylamino)uracil reductase RibD [Desulfonatronovibrio sp.]
MNHNDLMLQAVALAEKGKGKTCPNPCVGALVVSGSEIVGQGYHRKFGGDHAEVEAIKDASSRRGDLSSCILYVTLEPCNHHGKTPPCTRAILKSGIKEVIIGAMDPNTRVDGGGASFLKQAGVRVRSGIQEQKCLDLIADFILWQQTSRTYLYLKMASTLDGRIATRQNHSKWVTAGKSRERVHYLRSLTGAVIIGANTFYQDNPRLTCRGFDAEKQPLGIVVTSRLPDPQDDYFLLRQRPAETVFWTDQEAEASSRAARLKDMGCQVVPLDKKGTGLDLGQGLGWLRREKGIYYAMCEGGGKLALGFLEAGLADELWYFMAMKILGDEQGVPVFYGRECSFMREAIGLRLSESAMAGEDLWLRLFPRDEG